MQTLLLLLLLLPRRVLQSTNLQHIAYGSSMTEKGDTYVIKHCGTAHVLQGANVP
jgi:hypothetical protein